MTRRTQRGYSIKQTILIAVLSFTAASLTILTYGQPALAG